MEESSLFFIQNLRDNPEALSYLRGRGLSEGSVQDFKIGFARESWRDLYQYLKTKGFSDPEIERAGLAKGSDKGMYDRFRSRIMFPIGDSSGRIIAFSGRIFGEEVPTLEGVGRPTENVGPKYLNSPDTPIFNKSLVLYGLDRAKDSIRKNNFSILVEGQMDLVLSHQAGFKNTIATSGTALSENTVSRENAVSNLGLVRRLSENIILAFDADKAGVSATARAGRIALSLGMDVKVANIKEGFDPADLISKEGVPAWREAIRESKHVILFILERILKEVADDERKAGRLIKEKLLPYVSAIPSSIEKVHFVKKISDASGIPEVALGEDLKRVNENLKFEKDEIQEAKEKHSSLFRKDYIERRLFGIIFWQRELPKPVVDVSGVLQKLGEFLNGGVDKILEKLGSSKEDLIYEAEVFYGGDVDLKKDLDELLSNFKEEYLKENLAEKMKELRLAEEGKDVSKSTEILKECQIISNKIQDLKNGRIKKL